MSDYVKKIVHDDSIAVCFYIEQDKIMAIGDKMNELNEDAYMNGYNWEAFLNYYLAKKHRNIVEEMESDPEAGMYVAYFESGKKGDKMADSLIQVIKELIENESTIYHILQNEGNEIEWD